MLTIQAVRNSYDLNAMAVPMKYREIGDFHEYYSGSRKAPYLTIFVGGNHEASNHSFELFYGGWVAPNIYYMGAANVLRCGPVRIAGLSGIWKGYNYHKPHHERLPYNDSDLRSAYHVREMEVRKLLQIRTQVDVCISHDWPRAIEWTGNWKRLFARKKDFEAESREGTLGSPAARYVLDRLRPPYWFAAHLHCKFAGMVEHDAAEASQTQDTNQRDLPSQSNTIAEKDSTVSEELRALLPDAFKRPEALKPPKPKTLPFPEDISNKTTRFLALDKCLPHRDFLQLLEVESTNDQVHDSVARPYSLSYDKEWLAITRVFGKSLIVGDAQARPPNNEGEPYYRDQIETEAEWVEEHLVKQGKMGVPENFELTAPVFDASVSLRTTEQPVEYTNPQTSRFCDLLETPNVFDISEEERQRRRDEPPPSQGEGSRGRGHRGRGGREGRGGHGRGHRGRGGGGGRGRNRWH